MDGRSSAVRTRRLVLAPITEADVEALQELHEDPLVAHWTGPWTRRSTEQWARDMVSRWERDGVGKWSVRERSSGALVGRGGLSRTDLDGEEVLEVGWAVRDRLTGRGYGAEIGLAALDWAARHMPALPVVAFTEVHNRASIAVMRRIGLHRVGLLHREGLIEGRDGLQPSAPFALYRR